VRAGSKKVAEMKRIVTLAALVTAAVLGVTACGGGGSATTSTPAPSRSASSSPAPSPVHTARPGEPALVAVPGYDYADFEGSARLAKEILQRNHEHWQSVSVHAILTQEGLDIGTILLIKTQPRYDNPMTTTKMQQNLADLFGPGIGVTQETIQTEIVATSTKGSEELYAWYHHGTTTLVSGEDPSAVRDFVEAYLQAAHK
jgi:hypothetical protein